jgi:uncharacterized protein (TIGR03067 family)
MRKSSVCRVPLVVAVSLLAASGEGCNRDKSTESISPATSKPGGKSSAEPATAQSAAAGIEGKWQRISQVINSQAVEGDLPVVMEIAESRVTLTLGNRLVGDGTAKIDASASPPTIDLVTTGRMGSSNGRIESTFGIYQITGDQLVTCFSGDSPATRPKTFDFQATGETVITKYRRVR